MINPQGQGPQCLVLGAALTKHRGSWTWLGARLLAQEFATLLGTNT